MKKNLPERKSPNFAKLMFKIQDSKKFFCTENHGKGSTTHLPHHLIHRSVNIIFQEKWSLFSIFQFFYIQGWNISKLFQYSVGLRMLNALRIYQIGQEYKIGLDMNVLTLVKR